MFERIPWFVFLGITYLLLVDGSLAAVGVIGEDIADRSVIDCWSTFSLDVSRSSLVSCHRCNDSRRFDAVPNLPQLLSARLFTASYSSANNAVGDKYGSILSVLKGSSIINELCC